MSKDFEFNDLGLGELEKVIKEINNLKIKVGILGSKDNREGDGSNASIGKIHEFGIGMPTRSFLRMPLIEKMQNAVDESGALSRDALREILKKDGAIAWAKKIGILAEAVISDAFSTGGFGKWEKSNMKYKKVHMTLVETQQLRNSIVSEVTK